MLQRRQGFAKSVLEQLPGDDGGGDEFCASNHGRQLGPASGVYQGNANLVLRL